MPRFRNYSLAAGNSVISRLVQDSPESLTRVLATSHPIRKRERDVVYYFVCAMTAPATKTILFDVSPPGLPVPSAFSINAKRSVLSRQPHRTLHLAFKNGVRGDQKRHVFH